MKCLRIAIIFSVGIAGSVTLSSCQKEELNRCRAGCTTVQGRFLTGNGQESLQGLPLKLVWFKGYGFFGRMDVRAKASATTDANGNYVLRYNLSDEELQTGYLDVDIHNQYYYGVGVAHINAPQQRDTTVTAPTYWLPRPATLTCTLTNPAAMQGNDRLDIDITFKPGPGRNGYGGTGSGFASPAVGSGYSLKTVEVPAEQLLRIKVRRFRNSSYVPFSVSTDSLLLSRGEVRSYSVSF